MADPDWRTNINLPGDSSRQKWSLAITTTVSTVRIPEEVARESAMMSPSIPI